MKKAAAVALTTGHICIRSLTKKAVAQQLTRGLTKKAAAVALTTGHIRTQSLTKKSAATAVSSPLV